MKAQSLVVHDLHNPGPVVSMQQGTKQKKMTRVKSVVLVVENQKQKRGKPRGGEELRLKLKGAHDGCVTWTYAAQPKGQRQDRGWVHTWHQSRHS
jgi:hypothetical protein